MIIFSKISVKLTKNVPRTLIVYDLNQKPINLGLLYNKEKIYKRY